MNDARAALQLADGLGRGGCGAEIAAMNMHWVVFDENPEPSAQIAKSRLLWCKAEDAKPRGEWVPQYRGPWQLIMSHLRWRWL